MLIEPPSADIGPHRLTLLLQEVCMVQAVVNGLIHRLAGNAIVLRYLLWHPRLGANGGPVEDFGGEVPPLYEPLAVP